MPARCSSLQFLAPKILISAKSNASPGPPSPAVVLSPTLDSTLDISSDELLTPSPTLLHPPSPPINKVLASIESAKERDVLLETSPGFLARLSGRPRAVPTKSVESLLTLKERDPHTPDTDFSPDPFNRALSSPMPPVKEAFIEHVGGFNITHLRKDSYGALPKISSHPSSMVSSETPGEPRSRYTPALRVGMDLPRRLPPKMPFPTPTTPRQVLVRELVTGRQREPRPFTMKSESTTELTPAYAFAEHLVYTGAGSRNSSLTSLLEWDWLGTRVMEGAVSPGLVGRLGESVDVIRDRLRGHLVGGLGRVSQGIASERRGSAWVVGEERLGLLVDVGGGVGERGQ